MKKSRNVITLIALFLSFFFNAVAFAYHGHGKHGQYKKLKKHHKVHQLKHHKIHKKHVALHKINRKTHKRKFAHKRVKIIKREVYHTEMSTINSNHQTTYTGAAQIKPQVFRLALNAYHKAAIQGLVNKPYLTVIDYSLASTQKRFWVIDVNHNKVLYNTYVSHGKNTGSSYAHYFSNRIGSKQSSLGTFITKNTYYGGKGLSLRLQGIEHGINHLAMIRDIVIHGAWYANENFARHGHLGRSWGCPALPTHLASPIINTIKHGAVVFAYFPDHYWLSHSKYIA